LRLDRNATIAGQPIRRVRDLLRRIAGAHWNNLEIAECLGIQIVEVNFVIGEMVERGLLEECDPWPGEATPLYTCGPKGGPPRLASARLLRPITRAKADSIIAALLQRVESVNARADLLERVREVRVFGSYLEERDDLGDVDVAVKTERKVLPGKKWVDESLRRADVSGRAFSSFLERITYGHTEIMRLLKAHNPYLSLHPMDDLENIGAPSRVIFEEISSSP
jgi:predicted nucleotidyltransferase